MCVRWLVSDGHCGPTVASLQWPLSVGGYEEMRKRNKVLHTFKPRRIAELKGQDTVNGTKTRLTDW